LRRQLKGNINHPDNQGGLNRHRIAKSGAIGRMVTTSGTEKWLAKLAN
jgi:hypothetical protein